MQAPQPIMTFPQPPAAAQPVIPSMPPPNVVPAGYGAGQIYAQPAGAMPQPVVPNIAAAQNNAPVIPQMPRQQQGAMSMPEPVVDSDPPRSRSRLGPGQYGPYDNRRRTPSPGPGQYGSYDNRRRSTSPGPGQYGRYDSRRRRSPSPEYHDPPPSHNPLPRPPRDLFESTPYIRLLDELRRPIDNETLKRNLAVKTVQTQAINVPFFPSGGSGARRERRHRKGLFSVFGRRHRDDDQDQDLVSPMSAQVFYPTAPTQPMYSAAPQMTQVDSGGRFPSATMPVPSRGPTPVPVREHTPAPPAVRVHRRNEFSGLIPSSEHIVRWNHKSYPTAFHLHEALKFMEHSPEVAEEIRHCPTVEEARDVAIANQHLIPDDWEHEALHMMDEVIYAKLLQHPHLRAMLLDTGLADIFFADTDMFWGEGLQHNGVNNLGQSLMRVRDRFRVEGMHT
ncbi:hypothetical protein C8Q72DRAFT_154733 [Fomitopsis betulina]|nr:hypothetical protein C8Q72DRAFT_154733 [Fomitopsis betulina]